MGAYMLMEPLDGGSNPSLRPNPYGGVSSVVEQRKSAPVTFLDTITGPGANHLPSPTPCPGSGITTGWRPGHLPGIHAQDLKSCISNPCPADFPGHRTPQPLGNYFPSQSAADTMT